MNITKREDIKFFNHIKNNLELYADIAECLRGDSAFVLYDSPNAIMIRMKYCNIFLIGVEDIAEAGQVFDLLPEENEPDDPIEIVVRGYGLADKLNEIAGEYGFLEPHKCYQVVYEKDAVPEIKEPKLSIKKPLERDFDKAYSIYDLLSEEAFREHYFGDDFIAGYLGDELVGYCGIHSEGSMGMLNIFEEYKRRGFASELASALINRQISLHRIPYAQLFATNDASIAMQKKLGFTFANDFIYWIGKDNNGK